MAYCAQSDIEAIFGANSVSKWADMNNNQNSTQITARITQAIAEADEIINGRLRGTSYRLPLLSASGTSLVTPTLVTHVAAVLAGLWLHDPRGAIDVGGEGVPHALSYWKGWAYKVLDEIALGNIRLDAMRGW